MNAARSAADILQRRLQTHAIRQIRAWKPAPLALIGI
jgi:hypothetical protein